jgi:MFS family permease
MTFLKLLRNKKSLIAFFAIALLLLPSIGHAETNVVSNWLTSSFTGGLEWLAFQLARLVGEIAGAFVVIESYAVQIVLQINMGILNSPLVQIGFPIALSFANLIFVAGIIVIAIATILHIESYGIKNILWKLLVMAVLINFGLIITGTILGFSDSITNYMVKSITPDQNGGIDAFAQNIAGAFNPQRNIVTGDLNSTVNAKDITSLQSAFSTTGAQIGNMLQPILGLILSIFSYVIILIVLGALVVILLVRYIQLSFLLMSLPLAWAAWPFPAFHSKTSDWWQKFWKTAFYPIPLVFCLWLGLTLAQQLSKIPVGNSIVKTLGSVETGSNLGEGAADLTALLGGIFSPLADNFFRIIILGGVMVAGLAASNSMGAAFAGTAMNAIKAGQNRAKSAVTSRIKNRMERAKLKVEERVNQGRQLYARNIKIPAQKYLSERPAEAIGNVIQRTTGAVASAVTGGRVTKGVRLGFYGSRTANRIKTDKDGNAILTYDVDQASKLKKAFSFKTVYDTTGKEIGQVEVDAATGNVLASKIKGNNYVLRDGRQVDKTTLHPTTPLGSQITEQIDQANINNEKGEVIKDGATTVEFRKTSSGDWEAITPDYWTEKNSAGDLDVKKMVGGREVVVDTIKKTAVQDAKDSTKTWSAGHLIDKKTGKAHVSYVDDAGHAMRKSEALQGSKWTEEEVRELEKREGHIEEELEKIWTENKQRTVAGDVASVVGAAVGGLGAEHKGGGGGEKKSSGGGGEAHH